MANGATDRIKNTVKRLVTDDELSTNQFRLGGRSSLSRQLNDWVSPRLRIRFDTTSQRELVLYRPDGQRFLTTIEREQQMMQECQRAEQERRRAEQLANYLRSIGVDPDNLPTERPE